MEVRFEYEEELFCFVGGLVLERIVRRGFGVSLTGELHGLRGHSPLPRVLGWPGLGGGAGPDVPLWSLEASGVL